METLYTAATNARLDRYCERWKLRTDDVTLAKLGMLTTTCLLGSYQECHGEKDTKTSVQVEQEADATLRGCAKRAKIDRCDNTTGCTFITTEVSDHASLNAVTNKSVSMVDPFHGGKAPSDSVSGVLSSPRQSDAALGRQCPSGPLLDQNVCLQENNRGKHENDSRRQTKRRKLENETSDSADARTETYAEKCCAWNGLCSFDT